jgi:hypothetical protein
MPELRDLQQRPQRNDVFGSGGSFVAGGVALATAAQQLLLLLLLVTQLVLQGGGEVGVQLVSACEMIMIVECGFVGGGMRGVTCFCVDNDDVSASI